MNVGYCTFKYIAAKSSDNDIWINFGVSDGANISTKYFVKVKVKVCISYSANYDDERDQ